jgi:hypothetical protein
MGLIFAGEEFLGDPPRKIPNKKNYSLVHPWSISCFGGWPYLFASRLDRFRPED